MKNEMKVVISSWEVLTVLIVIQSLMIIGMAFYVSILIDQHTTSFSPLNSSVLSNISLNVTDISSCSGLSYYDTSVCLNGLFREIYVYVPTHPDYDYENFSQVDLYMRQYGGDCHESAMWYTYAARDLGIESSYVNFVTDYNETDEKIIKYMHAVSIIADIDGYCIMDQRVASCREFESSASAEGS